MNNFHLLNDDCLWNTETWIEALFTRSELIHSDVYRLLEKQTDSFTHSIQWHKFQSRSNFEILSTRRRGESLIFILYSIQWFHLSFAEQAYEKYEAWLSRLVAAIDPIINSKAIDLNFPGSFYSNVKSLLTVAKTAFKLRKDVGSFYDLMTAPASKLLDQFFESEPLKVTNTVDRLFNGSPQSELVKIAGNFGDRCCYRCNDGTVIFS